MRSEFLRGSQAAVPILVMVLFLLGVSTQGYAGSEAAPVRALTVEAPLKIDGQLSDAGWQTGEWSEGFTIADPSFGAPALRTRFKVRVDAHYLYFAAELERMEGKELAARTTERDGPVWRDDSMELLLHPVPSMDQYLHFVINSEGVFYDALRVQGGSLADSMLNVSAEVATSVTPVAWMVEMAIPLAELGLTQEAGLEWAINVARTSKAGEKTEVSTYAPVAGEVHKPNQFAPLHLEKLEVTPFLWDLSTQGDSRVVEEDGKLLLETTISVTNKTGAYVFFDLDVNIAQGLENRGTLTVPRGLDGGASRLFKVKVPVNGSGDAVVDATVLDPTTKRLLARLRYPVRLNYTPLRLLLTAPSYRNAIYASQTLDAIRGSLEINLPGEQLVGGELTVRLENTSGETLGEAQIPEPARTVDFSLPLPTDLPVGSYQVRGILRTPKTAEPYETVTALERLGPAPEGGREVRLDDHKVTLVDGKPFLPLGAMMVRPREDLETVAAQGYTAVMEYTFYFWKDDARQAWLDRLQELGLMAVIYPYSKPEMSRGAELKKPLSEDEITQIRELILRWKDHPALLAWYLADEPELHSTLPERLKQLHRVCREADPYHPTIILNNTFGGIDTYGEFCDILMPNPFPGFYRDGAPRRGIEYAYSLVRHASRALGGTRGAWMTPQTFSWADLREERANERPPNFEELRSMYYQGVIAGSTGFIPYSYQHGRRHPSIRLGLGYLAKEMSLLKNAILAPEEAAELASTQDGLLHSLRRAGDHYYLIVVNTTNGLRSFTAVLPQGGAWHVVSENRTVTLESSRLRDELPPYATRIYTTNGKIASRLDLEKATRLIEEASVLEKPDAPLPEAERSGLPAFSSPTTP